MSLSFLDNCPGRLQFYISSTFFYTSRTQKKTKKKTKKMSEKKLFLIHSQFGYVLRMFLKFWLISA